MTTDSTCFAGNSYCAPSIDLGACGIAVVVVAGDVADVVVGVVADVVGVAVARDCTEYSPYSD